MGIPLPCPSRYHDNGEGRRLVTVYTWINPRERRIWHCVEQCSRDIHNQSRYFLESTAHTILKYSTVTRPLNKILRTRGLRIFFAPYGTTMSRPYLP